MGSVKKVVVSTEAMIDAANAAIWFDEAWAAIAAISDRWSVPPALISGGVLRPL
jgi:hypothetical protein